MHRASFRRRSGARRKVNARQNVEDSPPKPRRFQRLGRATRSDALSFIDRAPQSLPDSLEITAETEDGEIMGLQHRQFPIHGVQFHPESILTIEGRKLLANFLNLS